jgi:hypothetical protein
MAEPAPFDSTVTRRPERRHSASDPLGVLLEVALASRLGAAAVIDWYVRRGGIDRLCFFPDSAVNWELGRTFRGGVLDAVSHSGRGSGAVSSRHWLDDVVELVAKG